MHRRLLGFTVLVVGVLGLAGLLRGYKRATADTETGGITIVMHVVDQAGSSVSNADLSGYTFQIDGSGVSITHTTDASGAITVLGLPPAGYDLTEVGETGSTQFQNMSALGEDLANGATVTVISGEAIIVDVYNAPTSTTTSATPPGISPTVSAPTSVAMPIMPWRPGLLATTPTATAQPTASTP